MIEEEIKTNIDEDNVSKHEDIEKDTSDEALLKDIRQKKKDLAKLRYSHNISSLSDPLLIRKKRKEIARALTILNANKKK